MQFDAYTPTVDDLGEEALNYADRVTIDSGGVDLHFFGSNVSASFQDMDVYEIAYGIVKEDWEGNMPAYQQSEYYANDLSVSDEELEMTAYGYLRALVLRSGGQL